ncbi:MAG: small multi-drug export protein [Cyclobacteriaceae bacterium]|nr:small multi-drug export protein [Cyclobacteriaceae bacterium]
MNDILIQMGVIYLAGITGLYKGVPVGIALNAHPVITAGFTALGSITTVFIIYFSGSSLRNWLFKKMGEERLEKNKKKFTHLMDRYGTIGLGLIVSGTLGPIPAALVGMAIVKDTKRLMIFLIIGIILWSAGLTAIAILGIDVIKKFLF